MYCWNKDRKLGAAVIGAAVTGGDGAAVGVEVGAGLTGGDGPVVLGCGPTVTGGGDGIGGTVGVISICGTGKASAIARTLEKMMKNFIFTCQIFLYNLGLNFSG